MSNDINTDTERLNLIRTYCYENLGAIDRRADEISRDGGYNPTLATHRNLLRKILNMTYGILAVLVFVAGCATDPTPLPTCAELGAPANLLCTRDGTCSWEGQTCRQSAPIDGGVTTPPPPATDAATGGSASLTTCEQLAPDADPTCALACTDFPAFMSGTPVGECRFVQCHRLDGETQEIGACVDHGGGL